MTANRKPSAARAGGRQYGSLILLPKSFKGGPEMPDETLELLFNWAALLAATSRKRINVKSLALTWLPSFPGSPGTYAGLKWEMA